MRNRFLWIAVLFTADLVASSPNSKKNDGETTNKCPKKDVPFCTTPGCIHAASNVLKNMDPSVNPCDDFYKFACGGFLKRMVIPDDKSFVISFNIISDQAEEQLKSIVEEPPQPEELDTFVKLKKFYNVCLNMTAIEEDNLHTAKTLLQSLGGWPVLEESNWKEDEFDWKTTMYKLREVGLPANEFVSVYVGTNVKNSSQNMIDIDQAQLGLRAEYLLEGFQNDMVAAYYDYLVDLAVIFGAEREAAEIEIKEAIEFEIKIAKFCLTPEERRNFTAIYNPMTVTELQRRFPSIPWLEYINNIIATPSVKLTADEIVDVGVPKFITDLEGLLNATAKRVQANYAMYRVVMDIVPTLTKKVRNRELDYKKLTSGIPVMKSRRKECVDAVSSGMEIATSALYVRKYFNEDAKKNAQTLVTDLHNTFVDMLKEIDWMDDETRKNALEKIDNMGAHIAYSPELLDDKKLEEYYLKLESSDDYLEFALNIKKFKEDVSFEKFRELVNRTDWTSRTAATKVNAYYAPTENSLQLPAGILQGTFFDNDRPHYMNYGAMGFAIGHEITHGFDDVGRQFNKDGELSEWWAENTRQAFQKKIQCIIDQYSNYTAPEVNLNLDGVNTQGENIADNGGVKEAYLAYQAWVERNGEEPRLPGLDYTPTQMFWIASANLWCSKIRPEYLKRQIITDPHPPGSFRVLGAFSNSDFFAKDFNCPVGSKMNPVHKCQVW